MILQCDQCNTKFRLDDSKLKPGGVKVRCSKCRHVFLAGVEVKHEESEFDAILSGLGAPAQEKREDAAASGADLAGFSFDEEPGAVAPPAAAPAAPAAAAPAGQDTSAAAPAAPTPAEPKTGALHLDGDLQPPPMPAQGETQAPPDFADFASFDFPVEPPESFELPPKEPAPDYSSFDFEPEPPQQKPQATSAPQGLEYDEFAFDEEPAPLREEPVGDAKDALDFGDFSFAAEPAAPIQDKAAPELDFGEFEFAEEPAVTSAPVPPAALNDLDYGDFSFATEPSQQDVDQAAPAKEDRTPANPADAFDFGAFSFSEEPAMLQEEPVAAAGQELDFGEFSFEEPAAPPKEASPPEAVAAPDAGSFSFSEAPLASQTVAPQAAPPAGDGFDFDEFTFSQGAKPAAAAASQTPAAVAAPAADARASGTPSAPGHTPSAAQPVGGEVPFDFGLGEVPTRVSEPFELDDDTPPLSIASRRKSRSLLTICIIAISVLVIVALSGAGFYLLQSGPAAFDKLGIGFVAKWFGMESAEEGRIAIRNQQAAFFQNKEAGELFVVSGEAVNSFRKARASIQVKVSLFDRKGAVLLQKTAYCGNRLSNEQLATLPMSKIESIMNNQFGDSLSNLGVQPGKAIGFVVAIANVPKDAADFGVEVVSSTVAGK